MGGKGSGRKRTGGIIPGDTMVKIPPRKVVRRTRIRPGHPRPPKEDLLSRPGPGIARERERMTKALVMKRAGFSYRQIAEQLGYSQPTTAYMAVRRMLQREGRLEVENMVALHLERTENYLLKLEPGIIKGNPRSVEVAVKVLERQSDLLGLDYEDRQQQTNHAPAVQINILADPRDPDAQRYLADIAARAGQTVIDGETVPGPLLPSAEGDPQH